jgi:diacylglycerol kinase (ATP)
MSTAPLINPTKLDTSLSSSSACTILMNAKAGALKQTASGEQLEALAKELGVCISVVGTHSKEEMRSTLRRLVAEGVDRVAVAGGDGTIALAVQELACSDTALGIIPQGTANNFATALRLPQDLPSALRVLQEGIVREVDLGKVGNRYFTESAGVGLFADALALYGAGTNKNIPRALWAMSKLLLDFRPRRVRLFVDGELHSERSVLCECANSFRMAYAVPIAPGAKLTDGQLDVMVLGDLERRELLPYYRAMRAQTHESLPKVTRLKAREIRIETRHRMNVHADDRVVGVTPATITAVPRALKVLVDHL